MPANNFYIALYDEHNKTLSFPYFVDEVDEPPTLDMPIGKGLTAYVLRTGKSLLCDRKASEELKEQSEADLVGAPSSIWLGVPLVIEKRIIGVMVVQHYSDPDAYTLRDQHILEFVSSEVAARSTENRRPKTLNARSCSSPLFIALPKNLTPQQT